MTGLEILVAVGSIASGVVGAIGAMQQAEAAAQAAEYNARIQENNALMAERNKAIVMAQADSDAYDATRDNRRQLSAIRAAYGASGFSLEGSPLDVLEDTSIEQEFDTAKIRYSGQLKALGYTDEAANFRMGAGLSRMEGAAAKSAGGINAVSSILGGVTGAGRTLMRA